MPQSPRLLRPANNFTPRSITGLALWLDASDASSLYTTDAGAVTAVSSPTEISGCVGWWDSADLSSMRQNSDGTGTVAAGDPVGWWKDKSATGANVTGSGSARPTLSATGFNSKQALVFNGSSTNLSNPSYTATNGLSGMTVIAVCGNTSGVANLSRVYPAGFQGLWMNGGRRFYVDDSSNVNFSSSGAGGSNVLAQGLYAFRFASSSIDNYETGSLIAATVNGTIPSTTGANAAAAIHIGSNIGANAFWNGPIAEYIIFNRGLTREELARVEAYLAAKWGISGVHAQATAASDPVGYWRDRSGNGRHLLQPSSSPRPAIGTQGSRRSLSLNGTSQWMRQDRTNYRMRTQFLVWRRAGTPAAFSSPFGANGSVDAAFGGSAYNSTDAHSLTYYVSSTGSHYWSSNTAANRPSIVRYQGAAIDPTAFNTFGQGAFVAPDTSVINVVYTDFPTASTGNKSFFAGVEPYNAARLYPAQLLEVLQYTESLTASQVRQVERYLASKWGITLAPQVSNADAQDWINRVYSNGGTVSASTAAAVNTFCDAIDAAGIRDRFYRLNLFCGGTSGTAVGLNSALVPLYRGPSLGGTQYGNTTDTNNGPFLPADYAESSGIDGDGIGKHLNTGLSPDNMGVPATVHIAAFKGAGAWTTTREFIGSRDADDFYQMQCRYPSSVPAMSVLLGGIASSINETPISTAASFLIATRPSSLELFLWQNGTKVATGSTNATTPGACANPYMVFTRNASGTAAGSPWEHTLLGYSIGLGLSDQQAIAYNAAMQSLQAALGRSV